MVSDTNRADLAAGPDEDGPDQPSRVEPPDRPSRLVRPDRPSRLVQPEPPDRLERLMAERGDHLLHAAIALTGSRLDAEDLLQAAVERLLRRYRQVDDLEAYLRRILYTMAADGWRRRGAWHRLRARLPLPLNEISGADPVTTVDLRDGLVRALRELAPRQRAVLILRYWEQLTQAETAEVLGCSEGTVKAATSRGLSRLRELTAPWRDEAATGGMKPQPRRGSHEL